MVVMNTSQGQGVDIRPWHNLMELEANLMLLPPYSLMLGQEPRVPLSGSDQKLEAPDQ